jgi:hypothetical protein
MSMTDRDAQRIAVLETNQKHMESKIDAMAEQVREMHELMLQAKGARWAILFAAGLAGFIASKLGVLAAFLGMKP